MTFRLPLLEIQVSGLVITGFSSVPVFVYSYKDLSCATVVAIIN
jgi:hypothetical protein